MENSDVPNLDSLPTAEAVPESSSSSAQQELDSHSMDPVLDSNEIDETFQAFDPRNVSAERTSGAIFTAIIGIAAIVAGVVVFFAIGFEWIFFALIVTAGFCYAVLVYFSIFWPSVEHRHRHWRLTDVGLEFRHGVWWKHLQAIPWARVQHADVSQGPIQRAYGVGTLTIHTAGTSNSSVNLAGLSHEVAISLRDEIIRQRASGDVV